MERYTIYCTPEQTRKALELGAPICIDYHKDDFTNSVKIDDMLFAEIPTTEQMIGWLEDQHHIRFNISRYVGNDDATIFFKEDRRKTFYRIRRSYKEALLACIDEALDYLLQIKL